MCASRLRRGRARYGTAEDDLASVGVLLPTFFFRSLFPFLPFVIAGLDPAIHGEATLAQCFPPALVRVASAWTTGIASEGRRSRTAMSGGSGLRVWLGIARMPKRIARTALLILPRDSGEGGPSRAARRRGMVEGAQTSAIDLRSQSSVDNDAPPPHSVRSPSPTFVGEDEEGARTRIARMRFYSPPTARPGRRGLLRAFIRSSFCPTAHTKPLAKV
jgi:hypothetical protein